MISKDIRTVELASDWLIANLGTVNGLSGRLLARYLMTTCAGGCKGLKLEVYLSWQAVRRCLPQGSVLGPIFFTILFNDLFTRLRR